MKGSIFQALESLVLQHRDMGYWNALLVKNAPKGRCYVSVNDYPDAELNALVADICEELELEQAVVISLFGRHLFSHLMQHYQVVVSRYQHFEALILNIHNVIHKEVNKLHQGANLPTMRCMMIEPGYIEMHYSSPRKLCILAEGLIYGAAEHFNMQINIEHPQCQHRGDAECTLNIYYKRLKSHDRS
ncbi:heme NO-binding domain-containing protein [Pseudoalteromonas shioyasakiensis]|uniref:heme NO-binding domain-containing protein n=1 Tax=Pseudoalteromonas shioyasakiensis TaxID=1190813 RepID=UPI0021172D60|nr:heme NO-binding domain-containing protein [Pseudoalteromonas shioyasakiensis]MCQ8878820.1 heme NO-binding domain-containing protein [Pseudoalteromonas shioyasakiensis]